MLAFAGKPVIEGRLGDGEEEIRGRVGDGGGEEGEGFECRGQELNICPSTLLVRFGESEPNVAFFEEDCGPGEVEDFFWTD